MTDYVNQNERRPLEEMKFKIADSGFSTTGVNVQTFSALTVSCFLDMDTFSRTG